MKDPEQDAFKRRTFAMPQFQLRTLMFVITAVCAAAALTRSIGIGTFVVLVGTGAGLVAWVFAFVRAPEVTKYGTVFVVTSMISLALFICWVVRAREEARQHAFQYHLQKLAREWHAQPREYQVKPDSPASPRR
jgi:hypothetical protein